MSQEDHDKNLQALLHATKTEGFPFNENKSIYSVTQLDLLGYRVSQGQIKPDPARLQTPMDYPVPKSQKELKRCLVMFAYYARWIANISEKILPLTRLTYFPMGAKEVQAFESLRRCLLDACLQCIDEDEPFTVECDASKYVIGAVLNQGGRPVAFMSRTLSPSECRYPSIEKEATSITEAVRKWAHYLHGRTFTLITDQKSVAFMFNPEGKGKIKNAKIQQWRLELSVFNYKVQHRPEIDNTALDAFSRVCGSTIARNSPLNLLKIHETLGHPGVMRLNHFVRQARRQDLAAGGAKTKKSGQKPEGGPHFKNTALDACSNRGAKREMGGTDFKWGGRAPLPPAGDGPVVRCKNLPFSVAEAKRVCSECRSCAEINPRLFKKCDETLIKAIQPWQRISIDFKGPVKAVTITY